MPNKLIMEAVALKKKKIDIGKDIVDMFPHSGVMHIQNGGTELATVWFKLVHKSGLQYTLKLVGDTPVSDGIVDIIYDPQLNKYSMVVATHQDDLVQRLAFTLVFEHMMTISKSANTKDITSFVEDITSDERKLIGLLAVMMH